MESGDPPHTITVQLMQQLLIVGDIGPVDICDMGAAYLLWSRALWASGNCDEAVRVLASALSCIPPQRSLQLLLEYGWCLVLRWAVEGRSIPEHESIAALGGVVDDLRAWTPYDRWRAHCILLVVGTSLQDYKTPGGQALSASQCLEDLAALPREPHVVAGVDKLPDPQVVQRLATALRSMIL